MDADKTYRRLPPPERGDRFGTGESASTRGSPGRPREQGPAKVQWNAKALPSLFDALEDERQRRQWTREQLLEAMLGVLRSGDSGRPMEVELLEFRRPKACLKDADRGRVLWIEFFATKDLKDYIEAKTTEYGWTVGRLIEHSFTMAARYSKIIDEQARQGTAQTNVESKSK